MDLISQIPYSTRVSPRGKRLVDREVGEVMDFSYGLRSRKKRGKPYMFMFMRLHPIAYACMFAANKLLRRQYLSYIPTDFYRGWWLWLWLWF